MRSNLSCAFGMLPDYGGGSIVNLAASIARAFGDTRSGLAASVNAAPAGLARRLADADSVFLVLLDGVGCRQIQALCPDGALSAHQAGELTSVFPSSTAPAITSILTATPPAAHGVPAWFVHEPGLPVAQARTDMFRALPMDVRGQPELAVPADLWRWQGWSQRADAVCTGIQPDGLHDSTYSSLALAGADRLGYEQIEDILPIAAQIAARARQPAGSPRQFAYIYLPQFDATAHRFGWQSEQGASCLNRLDNWFAALIKTLSGTGALVLAIADHGFVDIPAAGQLQLGEFPEIAACLQAPLAGEPRLVYCRVLPHAQDRFEALVQDQLGHACQSFSSASLLAAGWFGPSLINGLGPRCGTHTLVMRPGFTLTDQIEGERVHRFIGMHGGVDPDEMKVPLIVA